MGSYPSQEIDPVYMERDNKVGLEPPPGPPPPSPNKDWALYPPPFNTFLGKIREAYIAVKCSTDDNVKRRYYQDMYESLSLITNTYGNGDIPILTFEQHEEVSKDNYCKYLLEGFFLVLQTYEKNNGLFQDDDDDEELLETK